MTTDLTVDELDDAMKGTTDEQQRKLQSAALIYAFKREELASERDNYGYDCEDEYS